MKNLYSSALIILPISELQLRFADVLINSSPPDCKIN